MEYVAAARTDVGRKRQGNEDSFCIEPELGLYVVADGMGGHAAGEVASRLAVDTIREWMAKYLGGADVALVGSPVATCSREANCLLSSIRLANRVIYGAAQGRREYAGMGTTLVSVLAVDDHVALAHVGDSRIYRIREDQIAQLSRDHSLVQQQVEHGIISPEEAHASQYRHLITRALGLKESVEVDLEEVAARPGDVLLLCSDGLSDLLEDEEMLAIAREHTGDLEKACQSLVDRANYKGGDDNITALLVQAREGRAGRTRPPGGGTGVLGRLKEMLGRSAERRAPRRSICQLVDWSIGGGGVARM
ncbi:MAG: Stp1/IreP family PP2C-type Ser/Thr phosphatase [candidate division NC10 bacterium]|nr:Stp1/IreP family PP2C-type Ser/Thr phosphatase [candidate division NC10 bacterium]MBI2116143.1 Stp1/IreP family PP2C-type Ser/Thr phosphatase [candidate division NC10 bacterium]MBI2162537.1 Stp1/IreP family PP2C-type Ser/Thr phosphatase [candidate division NC10 bacterium]MBI2562818.1 Stp1/IreP family PP2C-type Ser/Thr phosphatase [candidate division NC10 bacterium]MBI3122016.1 Stp1/IreP family PP2C-type Ser/Thr phosphatase [candidate division NC10 bacterium]